MKKSLLLVALLPLFCLFIAPCLFFMATNKMFTGYSWFDLNFPKSDSTYVMPKGCKLIYNSDSKEYAAIVTDVNFEGLHGQRLRKYGFVHVDLWSVLPTDDDFYRNKDSSKVKFLVKLYITNNEYKGNFR